MFQQSLVQRQGNQAEKEVGGPNGQLGVTEAFLGQVRTA
jgi:hypothetical protein